MLESQDIYDIVTSAIEDVCDMSNNSLSKEQLAVVISTSLSNCLLSDDFITYIQKELGSRLP